MNNCSPNIHSDKHDQNSLELYMKLRSTRIASLHSKIYILSTIKIIL